MNKKSLILLEGSDATGKSTLANDLSKMLHYPVKKGSSFEIAKKGKQYMFNYMKDMLNRNDLIVDRSFISNMVYGKMFGFSMLDEMQIDELIEIVKKKCLVIYLYASPSTIKNRIIQRGDEYVKPSDIERILDGYNDVLKKLDNRLDIFQFNSEKNSSFDIARKTLILMG